MSDLPVSPQLLDDLIEGRLLAAPRMADAAVLARLAAECRRLRIPGPDAVAATRLRRRHAASLGEERPGLVRSIFGWFGGTSMPRPLRDRLAAGLVVVAMAGTSASYAIGVTPQQAVITVGRLAQSIVINLNPGDRGAGPIFIATDEEPTRGAAPGTAPSSTSAAPPTQPGLASADAVHPAPAEGPAPAIPGTPATHTPTPPTSTSPTPTPGRSPSATATTSASPTTPPATPSPAAPQSVTPTAPGFALPPVEPNATAASASPTPQPTIMPTPAPSPSATPTWPASPSVATPTASPSQTPFPGGWNDDDGPEEDTVVDD